MNDDISKQGGSVFDRPNQRPQVNNGSRRIPVNIDSYQRPNAPQPTPTQTQPQSEPQPPQPQPQAATQPVANSPYTAQQAPNPSSASAPASSYSPTPAIPQPTQNQEDAVYAAASSSIADIDKPMSVPTTVNPASKKKDANELKTVKIFGAVAGVLALLSLVTWVTSSAKNTEATLGIVLAIVTLLLSVGLLLRRELVRSIYVIASIIVLVFSLYATINYISAVYKHDNSQNSSTIGLQTAIKQYQDNNNLSSSDKAKYISALEKSESVERASLDTVKVSLVSVILDYAISLGPLIFLTRPRFKKVFART